VHLFKKTICLVSTEELEVRFIKRDLRFSRSDEWSSAMHLDNLIEKGKNSTRIGRVPIPKLQTWNIFSSLKIAGTCASLLNLDLLLQKKKKNEEH
jgi:hypothetical protein